MKDPISPDALIRARLDALARDLPLTRQGNVQALHRTRVASRRMRAALPVLNVSFRPLKMGHVRRTTRELTRALGAVRELDVALGILGECSPRTPARRRAIERVRATVEGRRCALRTDMLRTLEKLDPERFVGELAVRFEENVAVGRVAEWDGRLAEQLARRSSTLQKAIDDAGVLFVPDRLHAIRIALKKLRYALELANDTGAARAPSSLKALKRGQDLLGRVHDLHVLSALVIGVRDDAPWGETTAELEALLSELEAVARQLHGRFMATRGRLGRMCRALRQRAELMRRAPPSSSEWTPADEQAS